MVKFNVLRAVCLMMALVMVNSQAQACSDTNPLAAKIQVVADRIAATNASLIKSLKETTQDENDTPRALLVMYEVNAAMDAANEIVGLAVLRQRMKHEVDRSAVEQRIAEVLAFQITVLEQRLSNMAGYISAMKQPELLSTSPNQCHA